MTKFWMASPPSNPQCMHSKQYILTVYTVLIAQREQPHAPVCMADIQKELKQLERDIAIYTPPDFEQEVTSTSQFSASYIEQPHFKTLERGVLIITFPPSVTPPFSLSSPFLSSNPPPPLYTYTHNKIEYYKNAVDEDDSTNSDVVKDTVTIPTIFVSPCNSEQKLAKQESQVILLRAKEIANEIIGHAMLDRSADTTDTDDATMGSSGGELDPGESLVNTQAREMVHSIIEEALELNKESRDSAELLATVDLKDIKELFGPEEEEGGRQLTPVQTQILTRAKSMVHAAMVRSLESNLDRIRSMDGDPSQKTKLKAWESDLMVFKAQAIVGSVIQRAVELNMRRIEALYSDSTVEDDTVCRGG